MWPNKSKIENISNRSDKVVKLLSIRLTLKQQTGPNKHSFLPFLMGE